MSDEPQEVAEIMRLIDAFGSGPKHGGVRRDFIEAAVRKQAAQIAELQKEVEILRRYGNKDCTAMADAAIAAEKLDAYMTEYRPGEIANND